MSRPGRVAAAALAVSLAAGVPPPVVAQTKPSSGPLAGMPAVPVIKIIAIGQATAKWTPEALRTVMPREVSETVALHLQGRLDQWFVRKDRPGVVFIFNSTDVREVHDLLETLPLGREKMMEFDLIPVGPLAPLGLLVSDVARSTQAQSQQ